MRAKADKLFDIAVSLTPEGTGGQDWLEDLRADAEAGLPAWANTLKGYVRGLWGAGVIGLEDFDDFDKALVDAGY